MSFFFWIIPCPWVVGCFRQRVGWILDGLGVQLSWPLPDYQVTLWILAPMREKNQGVNVSGQFGDGSIVGAFVGESSR